MSVMHPVYGNMFNTESLLRIFDVYMHYYRDFVVILLTEEL